MRKTVVLCVLLSIIFIIPMMALAADEAAPQKVMIKEDIVLQDKDGNSVKLLDFLKAPATAILFSNTSCGACRGELKAILKLQKEIGAEKLDIISIMVDLMGWPAVEKYEKRNMFGIKYLLDPEFKVPPVFGFEYTPAMLVVKKGGEIALSVGGFSPAKFEKMANEIKNIVK